MKFEEFQNNCKEVIDTQASVQKKLPKELSLENPQLIGKHVPKEIVAKVVTFQLLKSYYVNIKTQNPTKDGVGFSMKIA